jgi:hypothetical protein
MTVPFRAAKMEIRVCTNPRKETQMRTLKALTCCASLLGAFFYEKARVRPSGDQTGKKSLSGLSVSRELVSRVRSNNPKWFVPFCGSKMATTAREPSRDGDGVE